MSIIVTIFIIVVVVIISAIVIAIIISLCAMLLTFGILVFVILLYDVNKHYSKLAINTLSLCQCFWWEL